MVNMTLLNAFLETESAHPDRNGLRKEMESCVREAELIGGWYGCTATQSPPLKNHRGRELFFRNMSLRIAFTGPPLGVTHASQQLENWVRKHLKMHPQKPAWFDDQVICFVFPPANCSEWKFLPDDYLASPFSVGSDDGIVATGFKSREFAAWAVTEHSYGGWAGLDNLRVIERDATVAAW